MSTLKTQDQGIIELLQTDYLPILVDSFLIDRKAQGLSIYSLAAGAATRKNYASKNTGPLRVVSSAEPILTTVRLLYNTAGFSSFYEMTGLPNEQLTTEYLFPWYNNVAMDSQLRFAVP